MPETHNCPHCGALYEVHYGKPASDETRSAKCQVCGQQLHAREGASFPHYELVGMPDGTKV
jgi:transcription elongation factor Elf1